MVEESESKDLAQCQEVEDVEAETMEDLDLVLVGRFIPLIAVIIVANLVTMPMTANYIPEEKGMCVVSSPI